MTHKDFVLIAGVLASARASIPQQRSTAPDEVLDMVAQYFAASLASTNPRFDRARFMAAAAGTPSTGRDKAKSYKCALCGQRIDDGKPCGCGARS